MLTRSGIVHRDRVGRAVILGVIPLEDHIPGLAGADVDGEFLHREILAAGAFQWISIAADHQTVLAVRVEGIFLRAHIDEALHGRDRDGVRRHQYGWMRARAP